jgi:uncharacterized protein
MPRTTERPLGSRIARREFLKTIPVAGYAVTRAAHRYESASSGTKLEELDYRGVRLLPSRWQRQMAAGRDFYLGLPDADILHGFREAGGHPAPGEPLGGWCGIDSSTVFGQWLSGLSRLYVATGEPALRDKALGLFTEWAKTLPANGDPRMGHYRFDKLVCGLVDLQRYLGHHDAVPVLDRVTDFAIRTFERPKAPLADPSHNQRYYGVPQEWYTLSENLYRAYDLTGETAYRSFAEEWLYHAYWAKFLETSSPRDAQGVHAYSHVNTFSSAAAAYLATDDPQYLTIVGNAYEFLQQHQCFATGGYGPNERFMASDGSLGRSLDTRSDTFETSCGSWAGFKLARYLMRFTGEARYGDWIERLVYNGIGAALPVTGRGRNFYYADYRVGGGMKVYNWDTFTCCSGTYLQNIADYHNLVYFRDENGLFVNLYLPSEVTWEGPAGRVTLTQETGYPDSDTATLTVHAASPVSFPLRFRIPEWTRGVSFAVNGADAALEAVPGRWASLNRTWTSGDEVKIRIPLTLRMEPVDRQHPDRVAVVRGPVVLALEGAYHDPGFELPSRDEELATWLVPEQGSLPRGIWSVGLPETVYATSFRVAPPDGRAVRLRFRPFYEMAENYPYFMYFDRKDLPWRLW